MVLTTLLPTPGSDVGADTVLIPTHLKPGPLPHPPISSQTDALLVALCRQRSDLAPDTPQACPGQGDMPRPRGDGEHLAGSPGTSSPTSLPGMGQLQPLPRTPSAHARLHDSGQRGKQVQAQGGGAI